MIEITLGVNQSTDERIAHQVVRTLECEEVSFESGAIVFHKVRFIDGMDDPNRYFALYGVPWHLVLWFCKHGTDPEATVVTHPGNTRWYE